MKLVITIQFLLCHLSRKNESVLCTTAFIATQFEVTQLYQKQFKNDYYVLGVFIDLSKVFDTIDHAMLLEKLEKYGIKGTNLAWFRSYLTNRKKYIAKMIAKAIYEVPCVEYRRVPFLNRRFFQFTSMIFHLLPRYQILSCLQKTQISFMSTKIS